MFLGFVIVLVRPSSMFSCSKGTPSDSRNMTGGNRNFWPIRPPPPEEPPKGLSGPVAIPIIPPSPRVPVAQTALVFVFKGHMC